MSFTFGAQPTGSSMFGQAPGYGTQQPFGTVTTVSTPPLQFGTGSYSGLQFKNPTTTTNIFGQTQPASFSLGAPTSAPGSTFGAPGLFGGVSSTPSTGLTFGGAISTAPTFGTGLTFGATTASVPAFGAPASSAPNFGYGSNFSTPISVQNTNLTFSSPAAAPSTALNFGTPASSLTFGTTPAAPTTGIAYGTTSALSAPSTGLTFGAPAASVPAFGAPPNTSLNFGSTPVTASLPFGVASPFNMPATTTQNSGFNLGNTMSAPNLSVGNTTAISFGGTPATSSITFAAPTAASLTLAPQAAAPTVPATGLSFNASSAMPSSSLPFGTLTTTAKTTGGLNFGTPALGLPTSATAPSTTLTFSTPFTLTLATTTSTPFGGLTFTTTSTMPTASLGLGGTSITTPATTNMSLQSGLGGVPVATSKQAIASTTTPQGELPPRDQPLPNELIQTVDFFKAFLKEQKTNSLEIARFSIKELKTVETNIGTINNTINDLENDLQKNKCVAEKLKMGTAQALYFAEMAQQTFEIPAGMQYDNSAPVQFFVQLLQDFERDLQNLRFHLENINRRIKNDESSSGVSPDDLSIGLGRFHQTFVTIAGRLQTVHNQVAVRKQQYLNLRRDTFNDSSNVFQNENKNELEVLENALKRFAAKNTFPEVIAGPSPFNSLGTGQAQLLAQNLPPAYPTTVTGQTTFGAPTSLALNAKPTFGTALGNTSSFFSSPTSNSNSFQLQKPPTGSKRGKS